MICYSVQYVHKSKFKLFIFNELASGSIQYSIYYLVVPFLAFFYLQWVFESLTIPIKETVCQDQPGPMRIRVLKNPD
jgi:hypothetical protein